MLLNATATLNGCHAFRHLVSIRVVLFLDKSQTRIKLIDFGMAKLIRLRAEGRYFRSMCGTLYYTAPEVFAGRYDEACDLWSLGTMLFVMLVGCPVFFGNSDEHVRQLIIK